MPPAHLTDWQRAVVDARLRAQGRASERAFHRRGDAMPVARSGDGTTPPACRYSAFIFGARRSDTVPLVVEATSWEDGVYKAATDGFGNDRGRGAARLAKCGAIRSRCCPSAAITSATTSAPGWRWACRSRSRRACSTSTGFAPTSDGKFAWPGFGAEHAPCLKWIIEALPGRAHAVETRSLGYNPNIGDLIGAASSSVPDHFAQVMRFDRAPLDARARWRTTGCSLETGLPEQLPEALSARRRALGARVSHHAKRSAGSTKKARAVRAPFSFRRSATAAPRRVWRPITRKRRSCEARFADGGCPESELLRSIAVPRRDHSHPLRTQAFGEDELKGPHRRGGALRRDGKEALQPRRRRRARAKVFGTAQCSRALARPEAGERELVRRPAFQELPRLLARGYVAISRALAIDAPECQGLSRGGPQRSGPIRSSPQMLEAAERSLSAHGLIWRTGSRGVGRACATRRRRVRLLRRLRLAST